MSDTVSWKLVAKRLKRGDEFWRNDGLWNDTGTMNDEG